MSRRFQFSLRTLACFALLVCLVSAIPHLLKRFGQFVEAKPRRAGEGLRVKGRIVNFMGPPKCRWELEIKSVPETTAIGTSLAIISGPEADREWLCLYNIDTDFQPLQYPGDYTVTLNEMGRQNEPIVGRLTITRD